MIRTEQDEYFIEPAERGDGVIEEEEAGRGRTHIVYRSSAVKKPPIDSTAGDSHSRGQSACVYCVRGSLLGACAPAIKYYLIHIAIHGVRYMGCDTFSGRYISKVQ